MHTIMLMNAKGGCGKTTLATNLATWYADEGFRVALADYDPQGSALDWLEARKDYEGIPEIAGIDAANGAARAPRGTDYLIMDVPAGIHGKEINRHLRRVDHMILPVLPSPLDIRACQRYLKELSRNQRLARGTLKVGVVANRVRENTRAFHDLEAFLSQLEIPFLTRLRESQNYIRAAETGLGLFELAPSKVYNDVVQWDPIIDWLKAG